MVTSFRVLRAATKPPRVGGVGVTSVINIDNILINTNCKLVKKYQFFILIDATDEISFITGTLDKTPFTIKAYKIKIHSTE